jgi:aryl carrier-like protein
MMPSLFVVLDDMPLTPNGKVDRNSLATRAPKSTGETNDEAREAPDTPTEHLLANTWRKILRLDRVGVHENFFAIGGHSLAAMTTLARLRDDHRVSVSIKDFFENPTIKSLGRLIDRQNSNLEKTQQSTIGQETDEEGFI